MSGLAVNDKEKMRQKTENSCKARDKTKERRKLKRLEAKMTQPDKDKRQRIPKTRVEEEK